MDRELMKHDRWSAVDFSLFYHSFDPIEIHMLTVAEPIHFQHLSIDLKCLFISKQSMLQTISHADIIISDPFHNNTLKSAEFPHVVLFRREKSVEVCVDPTVVVSRRNADM